MRSWKPLSPGQPARRANPELHTRHGETAAPPRIARWRRAPGGAILDFELATLGPVEWDLASFGPDCEAACDSAAQPLGLLAEALKPSIEQWRTMPFAGGLRD
jgi:hypothetical protein